MDILLPFKFLFCWVKQIWIYYQLGKNSFCPMCLKKYLSRVSIREIDAVIWDTMSTSLIAGSGHLASEAFSKEFVCFTRFASCHRDLLRVLVRSFSHVPGRCSTSFTNNLEHVTTFSYLNSFYTLDLCLPKEGISKICSHIRASDFALLITLGRLKQIY